MKAPSPPAPFATPWHGQAFALAVALNEAGQFTWPEWTSVFSTVLKEDGRQSPLDGSDDYYTAWLTALETILKQKHIADGALIADMKASWTEAFLSTPHGAPVHAALPKSLQAQRRTR